jgi:hypothetical protein
LFAAKSKVGAYPLAANIFTRNWQISVIRVIIYVPYPYRTDPDSEAYCTAFVPV